MIDQAKGKSEIILAHGEVHHPACSAHDVALFLKSANSEARGLLFDSMKELNVSECLYSEAGNARFVVHTNDKFISRQLYSAGLTEFDKFKVAVDLVSSLRDSSEFAVLLDIGANIGGICIPAVKSCCIERAIAVEPDHRNCDLLHANIAINGLRHKIDVIERAASSVDDEIAVMGLSPDNYGDHRIFQTRAPGRFGESEWAQSTVRTIRIDSLVADDPDQSCFVWMDIQGYEGLALLGAEQLLARKPPLVLEFWPYGMMRSDSFGALRRATSHYSGFVALDDPTRQMRPMLDLPLLFEKLGMGGMFTDILVI